MKKAKIALSAIAVLGVMGSALAFKAIKRSVLIYYTTNVANGTATKTLTRAIVTDATAVSFKYYTFIKSSHAPNYTRVTSLIED